MLRQLSRPRWRRGQISVLSAVSLVVLLGVLALSVDVAVLYVRKQALVDGTDAAALAGVRALPDSTQAAAWARQAATANRLGSNVTVTISFPSSNEIVVESAENVSYLFGRILGLTSARLTARSRAVLSTSNVLRGNTPMGLRPWGLDSQQQLSYGATVLLKQGSRNPDGSMSSPGNFYPVRIGIEGGADAYRLNIRVGGTGTFQIGGLVDTEPGNMVGPTKDGVDFILQQANQSPWNQQTWQSASPDNPRLVVVPVIDWRAAGGGQTRVPVVGFAVLYVNGLSGQDLSGVFLRQIAVPNADTDPGIPAPSYPSAMQTAKLVE